MPRRGKGDGGRVFVPDCLDEVRAIAAAGLTDVEIAQVFDVPAEHIRRWRSRYRDFDAAIVDGRTRADAQVIEALHRKAVGFSVPVETIDKEGNLVRRNQYFAPDTAAIKYWLNARRKDFRERQEVQVEVNVTLAARLERATQRVIEARAESGLALQAPAEAIDVGLGAGDAESAVLAVGAGVD